MLVGEEVALEGVNQFAMHLKDAGEQEYPYLEKLFHYTKVNTLGEFNKVLEDAFEFDLYTARTPTEYAREIICESGRFNYDSNLDPYIDFERYGRDKMDQENGLFTKEGYLVYHGENQEILNLLQETIGLKNDKEMENQRKDDWEL